MTSFDELYDMHRNDVYRFACALTGDAGDADPGWDVPGHPGRDGAVRSDVRLCLRRALARLPGRERRVFVLKDIEGFKHGEIGRMLGIPEATVRTLLHRAVGRYALFVLPAAFIILWGAVLLWVYRDAERRGMSGILWLLLVLIGNVVGLLIYAIVRSDTALGRRNGTGGGTGGGAAKCPGCGDSLPAGCAFCPHCGRSLKKACPACGKPVEAGWKACPTCGAGLDPGDLRSV